MAELMLSGMKIFMIRWELFKKPIRCTHPKCLERELCKLWLYITSLTPPEATPSFLKQPDFQAKKEKNSMFPFQEDLNQQKTL